MHHKKAEKDSSLFYDAWKGAPGLHIFAPRPKLMIL